MDTHYEYRCNKIRKIDVINFFGVQVGAIEEKSVDGMPYVHVNMYGHPSFYTPTTDEAIRKIEATW